MTKREEVCCRSCSCYFRWTIEGDVWPGGKSREVIACPRCGEVIGSRMISGWIRTEKLELEG